MIVITGALGFIGSNLLARLSELEGAGLGEFAGQALIAVDRFGADERWRHVADAVVDRFVRPHELDTFLDRNCRSITGILHLGAISATTEKNVDALVENNINLSLDLWDWCAAYSVPLIYASSAATYGDGGAGFDDDPDRAALAKLRPLNAYGWSKHVVDRAIMARVARGDAAPPRWAGLKFFNVYGPREFHKGDMRSVALKLYQARRAGEPWTLFKSHKNGVEDGGQLRDFIYVDDCVDVALWLLANPRAPSGLYNVGTGAARSFADLAKGLAAGLGEDIPVTYKDMPEALRGKYQYFTQAETARLRAAGYDRQFTSLEAGLAAYVAWLDANADR